MIKIRTLMFYLLSLFLFVYIASMQSVKAVYVLCPLLFIIHCYAKKDYCIKLQMDGFVPFCIFFTLAIFSAFLNLQNLSLSLASRDIIILLSLGLFLIPIDFTKKQINLLFLFIVISSFIYGERYKYIGSFLQTFSPSILFFPDNIPTKFVMGIIFGIFMAYFLARKRWLLFAVSFFVALLAGKRIVLYSLLPAFIYYKFVLIVNKGKFPKKYIVIFVLLAGFCSIWLDKIAGLTIDIFDLGINPGVLMQGRDVAIIPLRKGFLEDGILSFLLGHGPGSSDFFLANIVSWSSGVDANPHNDYLKLLYDYGIINFAVYFYMFYCFLARSITMILPLLYMLVAYTADNSLIFIFCILSLWVLSREKNEVYGNKLTKIEEII